MDLLTEASLSVRVTTIMCLLSINLHLEDKFHKKYKRAILFWNSDEMPFVESVDTRQVKRKLKE
jgi:hypothetical protein